MAKIKKASIDLDTTVVKVKFLLRGSRNYININCPVAQCIEFVDYINQNKAVVLTRAEKEMMKNRFYIFDDIVAKKTVMVSFNDIKYMEIPYFIDAGDEFEIKYLTIVQGVWLLIYQIHGESRNYYYLYYYCSFLDINPVLLKIKKFDFDEWRLGKIQKPSQEIKQIQEKKKSVIDSLTTDEKEILNQVLDMMKGKDYILEKDAIENIKGFSKTKIKNTIKKKYVLSSYKLMRIRANGEIKDKLGITSKGYPIILVRK